MSRDTARLARLLLGVLVLAPLFGAQNVAGRGATAPPLPAPTGLIVNAASEAQLQAAVENLTSHTTVLIAPGVYTLTRPLTIKSSLVDVAIRGASDNSEDVVLVGKGMTSSSHDVPYGIWTGDDVQGITIANLTIRDISDVALAFAPGTQRPHVYNVHLVDAGQAMIAAANGELSVNGGVVEYSVMEYTTTARDTRANAIVVQGGKGWVVRRNLFQNIIGPSGQLTGAAVLFYGGSADAFVEGNRFVNNSVGVALGLQDGDVPDNIAGIVRNNFFYRSAKVSGGASISVANSPKTQIVNNTIFNSGTYGTPIEYRYAGSQDVVVANNLLDSVVWARDGAQGVESSNLPATADMFVDVANGDLHLSASATSAIDRGTPTSASDDFDGKTRPLGIAFDIGADEFGAPTSRVQTMLPNTVQISGHMYAADGHPLKGGFVKMTGNRSQVERTDAEGAYYFYSLSKTGTYNLFPEANGYNLSPKQLTFTAPQNSVFDANFTAGSGSSTPTSPSSPSSPPPPPSTKPLSVTVSLSSPVNGARFSAPATIGLSVSLGTTNGTLSVGKLATPVVAVTKVEYYAGSTLLGSSTASPYALTWSGVQAGTYALSATATDSTGAKTSSAPVTVQVASPSSTPVTLPAPTVSLTAPVAGASYAVGTTVTVTATAASNGGTITKVDFYSGSTLLGTDTSSPYFVSWTPTLAASYSLSAVATDSSGQTTRSAAVLVAVTATAPPPPPPPAPSVPVAPPLNAGGLVQSGNMVYQGAFRVPDILVPGKDRGFEYGGTAPAFNPAHNSLFLVSHMYDQMTAEISIPGLGTGSVDTLPQATALHGFMDATGGKLHNIAPDPSTTVYIGGQYVSGNQLIVSAYTYYGGSPTASHFSRSTNLDTAGVTGPVSVGPMGASFYSGYMGSIPANWQGALGGPAITGDCCLSVISRTSYGPAAFAFDPANLTAGAKPLVYYDSTHPTLGDWGVKNANPYFNGTTTITGVVFPEGTSSVLFFGIQGLGTYCYGEGSACNDPEFDAKGDHAYPYAYYVWAYDAHDLAAVRAGTKQPWDIKPYAVWSIDLPTAPNHNGHHLGGATYDPASGRLFISQQFGDGDSPLIHVFTLK